MSMRWLLPIAVPSSRNERSLIPRSEMWVIARSAVAVEEPARIVERNVSAKGRRVATGGIRVRFTYAWEKAPLPDRVLSPLVRGVLRRGNAKAMTRLAQRLAP
jgi:hypothetical protein